MRRKKAAVLMNRRFFQLDLLALIGTIQERDDLCTGAAIGGAERGSGRAVGHAVLHSPGHSLPGIGGNPGAIGIAGQIPTLLRGQPQVFRHIPVQEGGCLAVILFFKQFIITEIHKQLGCSGKRSVAAVAPGQL